MNASSAKTGSTARRGVSERVAAEFRRQESFGSFTAEDCDVFRSEFID